MADITLISGTTNAHVEVIESNSQKTQPAGAAIVAGQAMYTGTNGVWLLADAVSNTAGVHLATRSANLGEPLTGIRVGKMDGYNLTNTIGTAIYLTATPGGLAGVTVGAAIQIGRIMAGLAQPLGSAPDKVLDVACAI